MKAMVLDSFGEVENFQWKDWPLPEPGEEEVRIEIKAISVNPVDYKMRKGFIPLPLPDVLGRDVAGTIDAVGNSVADFKVGDEVFAVLFGPRSNGAYAQYVATSHHFVSPKPASVSFPQAAASGSCSSFLFSSVKFRIPVAGTV